LDPRDHRIAALEAETAAKDEVIAAQAVRITALEARLGEVEQVVATLTAQVAALLKVNEQLNERLGRNSRNSNQPPSSDAPGTPPKAKGPKGKGRTRGAQPGHQGSRRELVPADRVNEFVDLFPPECENCWQSLPEVLDPNAKRYQQIELPPIEPYITEVRRHSVVCPGCRHKTCAAYDANKIPASPFGPRLMSVIALLTGVYHLSRRQTVTLLSDLLGTALSLGAASAVEARVSEAVKPAVDEAWKQVQNAEIKHTDGTSWAQAGVAMSLWTIATVMATVFKIVSNGSALKLKPLFGALTGILVSDRATALMFWSMDRRQICWAHLLRKFVFFSEKNGAAGDIGRQLLDYTGIMFEYWQDYRGGRLSRSLFRAWMDPVRTQAEALLMKAAAADIDEVSGSCADILKHRDALWTFVDEAGVEPTNNHAERELRAFVLWRRRSFGTQSERGNLFAERLMTIAHTARKQKQNVLEFLTDCCRAQRDESDVPSLFGAPDPGAA
jgi:transposase